MKRKTWVLLLAVVMLAGFAGTGQADVLYVTGGTASGITNGSNLLGAPNDLFAQFTNGDWANLVFGTNFNDGLLTDAKVVIKLSDALLFNNLQLTAHRVTGEFDSMFKVIFTNQYEIGFASDIITWLPSGYEYDYLRLAYSGSGELDVDAVGVNYGVPEPSTLLLLGGGLLGLVGYRRRMLMK